MHRVLLTLCLSILVLTGNHVGMATCNSSALRTLRLMCNSDGTFLMQRTSGVGDLLVGNVRHISRNRYQNRSSGYIGVFICQTRNPCTTREPPQPI